METMAILGFQTTFPFYSPSFEVKNNVNVNEISYKIFQFDVKYKMF